VTKEFLLIYTCQLCALHAVIKRQLLKFIFAVFVLNLFYRCILSHKPIYGFVKTNGRHLGCEIWHGGGTTSDSDFFVNRTIGGIVMTSLKILKWRPLTSRINFRMYFG